MDLGLIAEVIGAGAALSAGYYMTFVEPQNIQIVELELTFSNLPPAFDGYKLLHLSDLHLTKLGRLERHTMEIIGSREVDACVITGDVTAKPRASDIFRRVCSAIKHRDPIYLVLGNSEHKPWLETNMLIQALSFDGLRMLINSSIVLKRGEDSITIVGVDDAYRRHADIEAAFDGVDPGSFILFLTHCPSTTPRAIERGADLILAGHTHGGQVRIPGIKNFWTHMRSNKILNDGLYMPQDLKRALGIDPGHSTLFVNRGIGTSRLHIRLFCPPEIAYITLRRA